MTTLSFLVNWSHSPLRGHFDFISPSSLVHYLPPDEQLLCFNHLFFITSSDKFLEWETPWSPAWNFIERHLHPINELVDIPKGYLLRAFNLSEWASLNYYGLVFKFIFVLSVYCYPRLLRRLDRSMWTFENSLFKFSFYLHWKVDEIPRTIHQKHDKHITHVLFTSSKFSLTIPMIWSDKISQMKKTQHSGPKFELTVGFTPITLKTGPT